MPKTTILNTRPDFSSQVTAEAFIEAGFKVINFPCIEITAGDNQNEVRQKLAQISAKDTVIFTSQHAVKFAFVLYPALNLTKENSVIAVGTKTAEFLEQQCHADIWIPEKQNSQGVIELLQNLKNTQSIKLITAARGRREIQDFANLKAIKLEQINVYQRQLPKTNPEKLAVIEHSDPLITLATSITTINNLKQLVTPTTWLHLKKQCLACASQRIAQEAQKQGFENIINTQTASPIEIAQFLSKI